MFEKYRSHSIGLPGRPLPASVVAPDFRYPSTIRIGIRCRIKQRSALIRGTWPLACDRRLKLTGTGLHPELQGWCEWRMSKQHCLQPARSFYGSSILIRAILQSADRFQARLSSAITRCAFMFMELARARSHFPSEPPAAGGVISYRHRCPQSELSGNIMFVVGRLAFLHIFRLKVAAPKIDARRQNICSLTAPLW